MLLAEPPHVTRAHREKAVQLMFETQNVPALFLGKNPVLTAFASGKATSLVVDLGGQVGATTPTLSNRVARSSCRGSECTVSLCGPYEGPYEVQRPPRERAAAAVEAEATAC
jgi:hypothetical protein